MTSIERKKEIIRLIQANERVEVEELTKLFGVSKVTIRSDLDNLETRGLLVRTHGGAISPEKQNLIRFYNNTMNEFTEEKERIAKAASLLLTPGETLIIDNGSTTAHLAKYLSGKNLTVATGSLWAINELSKDDSVELIVLGGILRRYSMGTIGSLTRACLEQFHADWLFMGASSISMENGIWSSNLIESDSKQLMIRSASKVCLIADKSKMEKQAFGKICDWSDIDYFVTDYLDQKDKEKLDSLGVQVIIA